MTLRVDDIEYETVAILRYTPEPGPELAWQVWGELWTRVEGTSWKGATRAISPPRIAGTSLGKTIRDAQTVAIMHAQDHDADRWLVVHPGFKGM